MNNFDSIFLAASPSALEGAARILDFGDTLTEFNSSSTPEEADLLAVSSDWQAVGEDLQRSMDRFASEHPELFK
jgi:hypothetical protein